MLFKCGSHHAPASEGAGHPVKIEKLGVRTVDIHCHLHVPEADALLKSVMDIKNEPLMLHATDETRAFQRQHTQDIMPRATDTALRLAEMDATGVDVQAVSTAPNHYAYWSAPELGREVAQTVNNKIADLVASHPDRFVGLCTVPLQDADIAVAELERCVKEHDMRGVEISTNVNGTDLTRAGLEKFFAKVEELDVMIFMHPIGTSFKERMSEHYFRNTIGHPLESALAVGHLVFDGYLETYPGLKICIAHGGGYIPSYSGRFDHPWERRDDCRVNISKPPSHYVKKLYFDTVVFTDHQLRYLVDTWGADKIVMGTDYPYDMAEPDPVGFVDSTAGLDDDQKKLVMGSNAAKLLGLKVKA